VRTIVGGPGSKRRRITGILDLTPRGLSIVTDSGDRWILDREEFDADLLGRQVIAEGVLAGIDRLTVDWIGDAQG
jgi:hypothetical protein